jgi:hypothetical protein
VVKSYATAFRLASASLTVFTPLRLFLMYSFAFFSMTDVTSVSAGPPFGVLYLKPPSCGGLCDGVMTTPSHCSWEVLFASMTVKESTGVGVKPSFSAMAQVTPLATKTCKAVSSAGFERACVSFAIKAFQ